MILPLAQLLGRPMQAVVLPGCDEIRLPVSPEPPGPWTPAQRELLGLASRATLASTQRQAWAHALRFAHVDVLWRTSEGGERLVPSGFASCNASHCASQRWRWRSRANGVPVRALKVTEQARHL